MLQETINRCEKAYALMQQGERMDKARNMVGLGVGTMYQWLRTHHPDQVAPEQATTARYDGKRYDKKTKRAVRNAIKEGLRQGLKYRAIAEELIRLGINTPSGGTPNDAFVASQVQRMGIKVRKFKNRPPEPVAPAATKTNRLPPSILLMLEDEALTQDTKIEIILAYKKTLRSGL